MKKLDLRAKKTQKTRLKVTKARASRRRIQIRHIPPARTLSPWWTSITRRRAVPLKFASLFLILALNASGLTQVGFTAAYLIDQEVSTENDFLAGLVDFTLVNGSFTPTSTMMNLVPGTTTKKDIDVVMNPLSNPMQYFASSTNFVGDMAFCDALQVNMVASSTILYSGPLKNLLSSTTVNIAPWTMTVSVSTSTAANAMCMWNTDYNGWQIRNQIPQYGSSGFSDTETVSHKVWSGGLRINKVYYDVDEGGDMVEEQSCSTRSPGYWMSHEGCGGEGGGSSIWKTQVNALSLGFSSWFATSTGNQICKMENVNLCPNGNTLAGKRCRAQRHLLANELNVVSGKLDLNAIIAGSDNGDDAFDRLGLSSTSTVRQAISAAEKIVASSTLSSTKYNDAGKVMERLYYFYENECKNNGKCIYNVVDTTGRGKEPANEWVEIYNQTDVPVDLNTWKLCDGEICETLNTLSTSTIPGKGYAIVTASSTTFNYWNVPLTIARFVIPDGTIGNGLSNNEELLILKRPDGLIVDQMNYGIAPELSWANYNADVWDPPVPGVPEGHMLSRIPSGYDTDQPSDWHELVPPLVDLIYPSEADTNTNWGWGQTYNITWSAINPNGPSSALNIDLFYIEDIDHTTSISTADRIRTIATSTPNDGTHLWTVPSGFIGWVWVKLVATGPENPLNNTIVTSGKIWDPPQPVNELWGEEQETRPIDSFVFEEEYSDEVIDESLLTNGTTTDELGDEEILESDVLGTTTDEVSGGLQAPIETPIVEEEAGEEILEEGATTTEETHEEESAGGVQSEGTSEGTEESTGTTTEESVEEPEEESQEEATSTDPIEEEQVVAPEGVPVVSREEEVVPEEIIPTTVETPPETPVTQPEPAPVVEPPPPPPPSEPAPAPAQTE